MNDYSIVGLYNHNIESYKKIKEAFQKQNIVGIVHATGTGKSYNALQLAYDNKDKKIVYIVPSNAIVEHLKNIIEENPNLEMERDFPNLEFRTYQSLLNLNKEELQDIDCDLLIFDEFHHIGAPVWGARVKRLIESHPNIKIFGMTAYTIRSRGTANERDMIDASNEEIFSNKIVSEYDLCDAMIDGVLPKPIYKSAYINLDKTEQYLTEKIENLNHNSKDYIELSKLLKDIKRRIHEAPSMKEVFQKNIKAHGKYIYFCPMNAIDGVNNIESIQKEVRKWLNEIGLTEQDFEFYTTTALMGEEGRKNREAFYHNQNLNGKDAENKLRIMFAINQYNEGVHAPGVDGIIMGRGTTSDIVFFEQLGRALSVRGKTKEEYDELYKKTIDELVDLCKKRDISVQNEPSKKNLVELLLAPVIIDLVNNIDFIKELENKLKIRVENIHNNLNTKEKRVNHLDSISFDIDMLNQDLYELLKYSMDRLSYDWMSRYQLAVSYYEHYGNLQIPTKFKTINGYEEDNNGFFLGQWIWLQRHYYNNKSPKLSEERIQLLNKIGMCWDNQKYLDWNDYYSLAVSYYKHHGNLEIPRRFKTINGYEKDEKGISLGNWLSLQRDVYNNNNMKKDQINLLNEIGMRWENLDKLKWENYYDLAKSYFQHYENLEIPRRFKTINGFEQDENGINLGNWLTRQRQAYNKLSDSKITNKQIELLNKIGIRWELKETKGWDYYYGLAKNYYEYHGNLEIPSKFKTKTGYKEDKNGDSLGQWLVEQRKIYNQKNAQRLNTKRIELLNEIGMRWEKMDKWMNKYNLAKAYYQHHGNLKIPQNFKTINGYDEDKNGIPLGLWISNQRQNYKDNNLIQMNIKRIGLLNEIGMIWKIDKTKKIEELTSLKKDLSKFQKKSSEETKKGKK